MTYLLKDTMPHFTHRINESLKLMNNCMKVWCALSHTLGQCWNFIQVIYEDILESHALTECDSAKQYNDQIWLWILLTILAIEKYYCVIVTQIGHNDVHKILVVNNEMWSLDNK